MNPFDFPFALLAFFGFVAIMPVWMYFVSSYPAFESMPVEARFVAQLVLPATVGLTIASWLQGG
jgi:hypothetical protein